MSQIKEKVRNYLQTDRSLSGGVVLYQSLPGRNMALAASYGKMIDSEKNRKEVYYELCKLSGIPHGEMNSLLAQRIESNQEAAMEIVGQGKVGSSVPEVDRFENMEWNDIRKEAGELPEEFAPTGNKKVDLLAALRAYDEHLKAEEEWWAKGKKYEGFSEEDLSALVTARGLSLGEDETKKTLIGQLIVSDENTEALKKAEEQAQAEAEEAEKKSSNSEQTQPKEESDKE